MTINVELRDFFAANCADIDRRMPKTMQQMVMAAAARNITSPQWIELNDSQHTRILKGLSFAEMRALECRLRYEYADDMLEAQLNVTPPYVRHAMPKFIGEFADVLALPQVGNDVLDTAYVISATAFMQWNGAIWEAV